MHFLIDTRRTAEGFGKRFFDALATLVPEFWRNGELCIQKNAVLSVVEVLQIDEGFAVAACSFLLTKCLYGYAHTSLILVAFFSRVRRCTYL